MLNSCTATFVSSICGLKFSPKVSQETVGCISKQDGRSYLLNRHHNLDGIETVKTEIVCEVCVFGDLFFQPRQVYCIN